MATRQEMLEKQKPQRTPMGRRNVLTVKGLQDTDEFHYHWFNDVGARLYNCLDAGYMFVEKSGLAAGDLNVESARGTESVMCKGVGRGTKAYLMKIPMEFYREDQKAKQLELDAVEAEIKAVKGDGKYGKVELDSKKS